MPLRMIHGFDGGKLVMDPRGRGPVLMEVDPIPFTSWDVVTRMDFDGSIEGPFAAHDPEHPEWATAISYGDSFLRASGTGAIVFGMVTFRILATPATKNWIRCDFTATAAAPAIIAQVNLRGFSRDPAGAWGGIEFSGTSFDSPAVKYIAVPYYRYLLQVGIYSAAPPEGVTQTLDMDFSLS